MLNNLFHSHGPGYILSENYLYHILLTFITYLLILLLFNLVLYCYVIVNILFLACFKKHDHKNRYR